MRKCSFTESGDPIILGVLKERTADATIEQIKRCEAAGATAFNLHISLLAEESRKPDSLKRIFEAASSPVMAVHYNRNPQGVTRKDTNEMRVNEMVRAVEYGTAGIDLQGHMFCSDTRATQEKFGDPEKHPFITARPKEVIMDPELIEKQREVVKKVHSLGGEVLMSCHTGVFLNTEQIVSLAKFIEEREPDFIKIVTPVDNKDGLLVALNSVKALKRELHTKFSYHCSGRVGRITRYIGPYFGSSQVFAMDHYNEYSDKEQLLISSFKAFYEEVKSPETRDEWLASIGQ